jgi:hypothetical protein
MHAFWGACNVATNTFALFLVFKPLISNGLRQATLAVAVPEGRDFHPPAG